MWMISSSSEKSTSKSFTLASKWEWRIANYTENYMLCCTMTRHETKSDGKTSSGLVKQDKSQMFMKIQTRQHSYRHVYFTSETTNLFLVKNRKCIIKAFHFLHTIIVCSKRGNIYISSQYSDNEKKNADDKFNAKCWTVNQSVKPWCKVSIPVKFLDPTLLFAKKISKTTLYWCERKGKKKKLNKPPTTTKKTSQIPVFLLVVNRSHLNRKN